MSGLYVLRKFHWYIDSSVLLSIYWVNIHPHLNYGTVSWANYSNADFFFIAQNQSLRQTIFKAAPKRHCRVQKLFYWTKDSNFSIQNIILNSEEIVGYFSASRNSIASQAARKEAWGCRPSSMKRSPSEYDQICKTYYGIYYLTH